jgi:hypothetical protein
MDPVLDDCVRKPTISEKSCDDDDDDDDGGGPRRCYIGLKCVSYWDKMCVDNMCVI